MEVVIFEFLVDTEAKGADTDSVEMGRELAYTWLKTLREVLWIFLGNLAIFVYRFLYYVVAVTLIEGHLAWLLHLIRGRGQVRNDQVIRLFGL